MIRCFNCHLDNIPASTQTCPNCGALFNDLLAPSTMLHGGKYRINNAIGQGGFGITYEAEHVALKQLVAIKEYYPLGVVVRNPSSGKVAVRPHQKAGYDHALQRFVHEGQLLTKINHWNVIRVRDLFEEHDTAYLVMDFLSAKTLREEMKKHPGGILPIDQVRTIIEQLVSALEAVHSVGVYHLDIKPENVLLTNTGQVILIDFGAAKQALGTTITSSRFATEEYAAPELFTKQPLGPYSDVFELGMMLHEMLTGTLPPPALQRHVDHVFDPIGLSEPWRTLVRTATQMSSAKRPSSVRQWWQSIAPTYRPGPPAQGIATTPVRIPNWTQSVSAPRPSPQHAKPPSVLWRAAAFFGLSFAVALFWPRVIFFGGGPYVFISIIFILETILHITFAYGVSVLKSWAWPFGIWLNIANIVISIIVYAEGYDMLLSALISAIFIGWLANSNVRKALNQP